ncbi:cupin domain-containing protein [Thermosynechococcus sp.]|uniref:cupin domain-containing protein n=1 Tax=Thermosynechococcus sp. TaxID=2814275 RepID=UPI00391AA374
MNTWPAKAWIEALDLQPHPEGGYFREVYRSAGSIPQAVLPSGFQGGDRQRLQAQFPQHARLIERLNP